jgi:hypothetical protein
VLQEKTKKKHNQSKQKKKNGTPKATWVSISVVPKNIKGYP